MSAKAHTRKRLGIFTLSLAAAGFVALNGLAYRHAGAMMRYAPRGVRTAKPESLTFLQKVRVLIVGVTLPRPVSDRPPSALDPAARSLSIPGPEGHTLGAWYCDRGPHTPLVILLHGYGAEKSCLLSEAQAFLDLGASVLLADFRGSGESSGHSTTIGYAEAEDVAALVRYARGDLAHRTVVLFGQSMGAAAILRAVRNLDVRPDAVILEAVFDTMLNTVRNRFHAMRVPSFPSAELLVFWGGWRAGFNGFAHRPVEDARALTCPALFMHGSEDPRAALEEGHRVFAAAAGAKEFVTFPGAGHESYVARSPETWKAAVRAFLARMPDQNR